MIYEELLQIHLKTAKDMNNTNPQRNKNAQETMSSVYSLWVGMGGEMADCYSK